MRFAAGKDQPLIVNPGRIDYEVRSCNFDFGTSPLRIFVQDILFNRP
jgi:hypothetical protein